MCGIFAVLSRTGRIERSYDAVLDTMRHRGPDDRASALVDECAWLGHRRLSILDLSARGRQPMASRDGNLEIVFNGEIFNYVELREECRREGATFETGTDTEVLLEAWRLWGSRCLPRLKGMFAFVLVDRAARTATLARDAFGIKPLHVAVTPHSVAVSSEVLPLVRSGHASDAIDAEVAYEYLRFGATASTERTILRDVRCIPAAHVAVFDFRSGTLGTPTPYWRLEPTERRITFADAVAECRERFLDNVRLHLRSDVPVGAALSGGIDSSAIVCAMRLLEPDLDLNTFSYIADDSRHTEERWVDLVHATVGGVCHKVRPGATDVAEELELLVRHQGEPFASASMFAQFQIFRRAREAGVPVTLDGQGADELLAGYWPFVGTRVAELARGGHLVAASRLWWNASPDTRGRATLAALTAQAALGPAGRALGRRVTGRALLPAHFDREWLAAHGVDWRGAADALIGRHRTLKAHLADTVTRGSLPNLLRYADRNSMAFSVESRVPFLTHDFADFVLSLPAEYLIARDGTRKHVFREAMRGILPEPIRTRRDKIGFFADDAAWLRGSRERLRDVWREVPELPMLERGATTRFIDDYWAGRHAQTSLMWRALVYALWRRELAQAMRDATIAHAA